MAESSRDAQQACREMLRRMADGVGDDFYVFDAELRCTDCGGRLEAVGRGVSEVFAQAGAPQVEAASLEVLRTGRSCRILLVGEAGDGQRSEELTICPCGEGVCVMARDVTDRLRSEHELRASEARYRMLLEDVPAITYAAALDEGPSLIYVSPQVEELLGCPPERYEQEPLLWQQQVHPLDRERIQGEVRQARAAGRGLHTDYRVVRPDGRTAWLRDEASLVRDAAGKPLYWQGVAFDITDRKEAEAKLHEYKEKLRSLALRLSAVEEQERRRIAVALHDNIAQMLALSKIKLGLAREHTEEAHTAESLAEVREMIQACLDYSRSLVFDLSPPILYEMGLEAALSRLTERIEDQYGIQAFFEDDGAPKPLGEEQRAVLFQAARELLMNAARHAGPCRVKVFTGVQEGWIVVRVEDDGSGFDAAAEPLRPREDGGFGLFNVRERLDQMGGRLELRSQPGRGTIATLLAPLKAGSDH